MGRLPLRGCRGLSLLEAIVALAVLAALTAVALEVLRTGSRGLVAADGEARALAIARNELARAGVDWNLTDGTRSGEVGAMRYRVDARPRRDADDGALGTATDGPPLTFDVTVTVTWTPPDGRAPRAIRLDTIRFVRPRERDLP